MMLNSDHFPYRAGLDTALHGVGLPYGYTLTIWSSSSILSHFHGPPGIGSIFLLVLGAVAGYGGLRLFSEGAARDTSLQLSGDPHEVRAGLIHLLAIALAVGVTLLATLLPGQLAWAIGGFSATFSYLAVSASDLALREVEKAGEAEEADTGAV